MAFCTNCGSPLPDGNARFCTACGAEQKAPAAAPGSVRRGNKPSPLDAPPGLDKRTFFKLYSPGAKTCVGAGILGYVCAGITAVVAITGVVSGFNITALLDAGVTLALSLLIHLLKSRVAAIVLLAYAVCSIIIVLASTGMFSGWLVAIAAVMGIAGSFAAAKEWKEYQLRTQNAEPWNTNAPTAL